MRGIEELDLQSLDSKDEHRFQYNGKEKEESFGLYWNDHGARNLDVQLGRWNGIDPLAEEFVSVSSYVSMNNNPISYVDLDGMEWVDPKEGQALMEAVNNKVSELHEKQDKLRAKIDKRRAKGKSTHRQYKRMANNSHRLEQLYQSQDDIAQLAIDPNNKYDLVSGSNQGEGLYGVQKNDQGIINIYGDKTATHIHEIRHVTQALDSQEGINFDTQGNLLATTRNGLEGETDAYRAEYGYSGKGAGGPGSDMETMEAIANLSYKSNEETIYVYPEIRKRYLIFVEYERIEKKRERMRQKGKEEYYKNGKLKFKKKK